MKQNTFYIITGIIGLLEVLLFLASIHFSNPFLIVVGFVAGAGLYFVLRRTVTDCHADERQNMIDMKTASATLKAFWVCFFTVNLATVVYVFSAHLGFQNLTYNAVTTGRGVMNEAGGHAHVITIHPNVGDVVYAANATPSIEIIALLPAPPEMIAISYLGAFGVMQILLLVLMMFIYAVFRIYYSHKFGEWDDDEE